MRPLPLNPGRQARLELAIWDVIDARDEGDPGLYRNSLEKLERLHVRLRAEQNAEEGYMPQSIAGAIAVLELAEQIIRAAARSGVMGV